MNPDWLRAQYANTAPETLRQIKATSPIALQRQLAEEALNKRTESDIAHYLAEGKIRRSMVPSIRNRQVKLGMNGLEVQLAWGPPDRNNETVSVYGGRREQWVYRYAQFRSQYVYLENGRVTSISNS